MSKNYINLIGRIIILLSFRLGEKLKNVVDVLWFSSGAIEKRYSRRGHCWWNG